jgi:hypothetical protein
VALWSLLVSLFLGRINITGQALTGVNVTIPLLLRGLPASINPDI